VRESEVRWWCGRCCLLMLDCRWSCFIAGWVALSPEAEKGGGEAWELRGPGEGGAWGVARGMRRGAWWARTCRIECDASCRSGLSPADAARAWNCSLS